MSVLLVAGSLLVVTMSFSVSKKLLSESREVLYSTLLLREKMFEIEETGQTDGTSLSGSWPGETREWSVDMAPVAKAGLEEVRLEVFPRGKPGTGYEITTYLRKTEK